MKTKNKPKKEIAIKADYSDILARTGLTEKEAYVYETLLKGGQLGIGEILERVPYKRGDAYNILYALRDKGTIEQTLVQGRIHFRPADPHKIKEYIFDQERRYREADTLLDSVLPGLMEMFKLTTDKPIVRVLEGFEGIKEIYEDTLKEKASVTAFLEASESDPQVWKWLRDHYVHRRIKAQIPARVIISTDKADPKSNEYIRSDAEELRETRVVDKKIFPAKLEIQIYGNKVSFANYNKKDALIGVIIDNKFIAETMRGLFELAWISAEN